MEFKRQLYIKNLFLPSKIINGFDCVEFNSIEGFKTAVKKDWFNIKKGDLLKIIIHSYSDFRFMLYLHKAKKQLFDEMEVWLIIPKLEVMDEIFSKPIPEEFNVKMFCSYAFNIGKYFKANSKWIRKNILGMIANINADTIALDVCQITDNYNMNNIRFFILDIDYESFRKYRLDELDKFEYWFAYLRNWMIDRKQMGSNQELEIMTRKFHRPIFVDDNLFLYLDAHKDETVWSFPLSFYAEDDGNTLSNSALNHLHQYLDLTPAAIYSKFNIKNWCLISYYQIVKMGFFINEIPLIMSMIQRWLYGQ